MLHKDNYSELFDLMENTEKCINETRFFNEPPNVDKLANGFKSRSFVFAVDLLTDFENSRMSITKLISSLTTTDVSKTGVLRKRKPEVKKLLSTANNIKKKILSAQSDLLKFTVVLRKIDPNIK